MTLQPIIQPGLFTEQVSAAHFISACSSDSQTRVSFINEINQKSPKPQGCIGASCVQIGKLKQKRGCKTPKKGQWQKQNWKAAAFLPNYSNTTIQRNRYHDTNICNTPSLQKASVEKSFQNAQYWPHMQKCGAKRDCLLLSRHLLIFVTPE